MALAVRVPAANRLFIMTVAEAVLIIPVVIVVMLVVPLAMAMALTVALRPCRTRQKQYTQKSRGNPRPSFHESLLKTGGQLQGSGKAPGRLSARQAGVS